MKIVQTYSDVQILLAQIRNLRKEFITNFYPDPFKTALWIRKQSFFYELSTESVLFFHQMNGCTSLFFCAASLDALNFSLKALQKGAPFVVDVISKTPSIPVLEILFQNGFVEHSVLTRMSRINRSNGENKPHDKHIRIAKLEELAEVQSLISKHFDEYSEHSPELEELEQSMMQHQIIVYEIDSQLAGFIIFDLIGVTLYLRFWFVRQDYRDKKVGSKLLSDFFWRGKAAKRQLLWVIKSNENAIKRYNHYGFENEEMYDFVLLKK